MLNADTALEAIGAQHAREPFSGVIRISAPDGPLVNVAYGDAHRSEARKMQTDTRLAIASGTKVFTAVAIATLVEAGQVSFDTPLQEIVTADLPHHDALITLAHLLSHTAGNPDYFDEETMDDYGALWEQRPTYGMRTPSDFLPMFAHLPQKFPAGERFSYNNAGYILLGLVIEAVSGKPYSAYVQEAVLDKAGMADSGFFAFDSLPGNCATGYLSDEGNASNIFSVPAVGGADGGMWTTAEDLERFWTAFTTGGIVSQPIVDAMLTPHAGPDDDGQRYGYGVWIAGEETPTFYVVGEDPGVSMVSSFTPHTGVTMTILANTDSGAWPMHASVMELLAPLG